MGRDEKRKSRLKQIPSDYTYDEAKALLVSLGFEESNKGKTSGSRVNFFRVKDGRSISLHKPHPGNIMKRYAVRELCNYLLLAGDLCE